MRRVIGVLVGVVVLSMTGLAWAQAADEREPLRVGTTAAPPFAMPNEAGDWHGLGIDLWRELAAALDIDFVIEERPFAELLPAVEAGELDAAVAAITVTAAREERVDFTHPFHTTGLAVAVSQQAPGGHWWRVVQRLASAQFLYVVAALALVLFVAGFLVWLFERRRNPEMFGGPPTTGLGSAFWWSAVTMTTVGYGDKAPQTTGGRAVALVWMFVSIIILSSFTAAITSSLTLSQLGHDLRDVSDLRRAHVGTVAGS
ncbi:MAG: transporter substrate-binding domain-containing protein, partial [Alphaproteobacteria bacterium]|nr:transporter substrate-binding domain-containing protein [Alphaproteobacteria bacterium]